ncbi:hypothetical protein N9J00_00005, partial [Acidimicrobiia bacterium]|nr:hypothetical protein [Acidimicrobiia bacterium]
HGGGNSYIMEDFQMLRYLEESDDKSKVFSKGKGHKESIQAFLTATDWKPSINTGKQVLYLDTHWENILLLQSAVILVLKML